MPNPLINRRNVIAGSSLRDNLVSFWELEESTGTRFDSYGTNHLTANNNPGNAVGVVGNALALVSASAQFLSVNDNAGLRLGDQDFTMTMWGYLTDKTNFRIGPSKGQSASTTTEYQTIYSNGTDRYRFSIGNGATSTTVTANSYGSPAINTWAFIVARRSKSGYISIQVNQGPEDILATSLIPAGLAQQLQIGNDGGGSRYWNGRIDQVGIWIGRLLTFDEAGYLYNSFNGQPFSNVT